MELYLSFNLLTHGLDKVDLRELPSSFLKRKECKVRFKFPICMDPWEMGAKEFLESSFFEKVKEEIKVQPIRTKKEENKEVKQE